MNIKFVSVGILIIAGLFLGNEYYWKKQFEQQARDNYQSFVSITKLNETIQQAGWPIKLDALNHYPHILVYTNLTQAIPGSIDQERLRSEFKKMSHGLSCGYFEYVRQKEAESKYKDITKGIVTVVEKDQVVMTTIYKSYLGEVLYENKQVLAQCPEFLMLKQSID